MEVPFTVTFHPSRLCQDVRYDQLRCDIEGGKPLQLTLTGMCIGTPPLKEVIVSNIFHITITTFCTILYCTPPATRVLE